MQYVPVSIAFATIVGLSMAKSIHLVTDGDFTIIYVLGNAQLESVVRSIAPSAEYDEYSNSWTLSSATFNAANAIWKRVGRPTVTIK